jgi:hypothetical protein
MVPKTSGTHMKWIVDFSFTLSAATSAWIVRAISIIAPEPLALSLALHFGWSRCAVIMTSRSGCSVPRMKACTSVSFPGPRVASIFPRTRTAPLRNSARSSATWFAEIWNPPRVVSSSAARVQMPL